MFLKRKAMTTSLNPSQKNTHTNNHAACHVRQHTMRLSHLGAKLILHAAVLYAGNSFAIETPVCPPEIKVEQKALETPSGWSTLHSRSKHVFINVQFSEDEPSKQFILAPSREKKQKGAIVNIWDFTPSPSGYWVSCIYHETNIVLTRKLPSEIKSCEVEYEKNISSPMVKRLKCV
jgi:hypothetical protein